MTDQSRRLSLAAQAAKALGHPARLRLLAMLRQGPLCVCQMTAVLELAPSTVSGHLLELRRADLVAEQKRGKWVEYRLRVDGPLARLVRQTLALVADDPTAIADLKRVRAIVAVPVEIFCQTGFDLAKARARVATAPRRRTRRSSTRSVQT